MYLFNQTQKFVKKEDSAFEILNKDNHEQLLDKPLKSQRDTRDCTYLEMDDMNEVTKSDDWKKLNDKEKKEILDKDLERYWSMNEDTTKLLKYFVIAYCSTIQITILIIFAHGLESFIQKYICTC